MEYQKSFREGGRACCLLLVVVLYVIGLAIWSPLFLVWPRRYAGLTFPQTVAVRFLLVRHIWTTLLGLPPEHCEHGFSGERRDFERRDFTRRRR